MSPSADAVATAVHQVASKLNEAFAEGRRGLVIVRCASTAVVDAARETLRQCRAPFGWRSLSVSDLDPPDLVGFLLHAGAPTGPAFLAYGMPRGLDGQLEPEFLDLLSARLEQYQAKPTLAVLLLTIDEMKPISRSVAGFWALRDAMLAWPGQASAGNRYSPAVLQDGLRKEGRGAVAGRQSAGLAQKARGGVANPAAGGMDGVAAGPMAGRAASQLASTFASGIRGIDANGMLQSPENTPWAGSPFARDEDGVPDYFRDSSAPAGRRWGRDLAPGEPELAEIIDAARDMLEKGETEVARRQLAKAAKRFREQGNALACAECYVLLGRAAEIRVDHRVAYDWYKAALDVYDQIEDQAGYSDCAGFIGYMRFLHGDGEGALEAFGRALERDRGVQDHLRMAHGYRRMGIISEAALQFSAAADQFEKAADLEERNEDRRAYSRSLNHLARIARLTGDLTQAARLLAESLALKEELEDAHGIASGYHELGNLRLQDLQLDDALEAYKRALELEIHTRDLPGLAATHAQIGLVQKERFVFKEAVRSLTIAQELFRRLSSPNASAITPVLHAAREMVDAFEARNIENEVEGWLDQIIARPQE